MLNDQLLNPKSIVIVGGSEDISKPGGKVLKNIKDGGYSGLLSVINPKADKVQNVKSYRNIEDIGDTDLAILAIAAKYCLAVVEFLARNRNTKAFIILSAGFSEESEEGAILEKEIVNVINETGGCLIGPNCIGFLNPKYSGVFTSLLHKPVNEGVDFISGSGATAVYIMESGIPKGLKFRNVFSVGNSAQNGVEDILKYMDENFDATRDSKVKLLYIESIRKPEMLLRHATSLTRKGCRIAAIKAGSSEAGSRAASSHTGALASSDSAVEALLKKAGIVRCHSREELTTVASIFMYELPEGKNIAVITHAGGPAVMLTDALSEGGLNVPQIQGSDADALLAKLYPGSSVSNPIDFLATGTAEQLGLIIDACNNEFQNIDAMVVIFGSPGLFKVFDVYDLLDQKMKSSIKPIYPILPSIISANEEIEAFLKKDRTYFSDEVLFGNGLTRIMNTPFPVEDFNESIKIDSVKVGEVIRNSKNGFLSPVEVSEILDASFIPRIKEGVANTIEEALIIPEIIDFPLVMKVIGPVHKSDVGGVELNVMTKEEILFHFERMMQIDGSTGVLFQPMASGLELFAGIKEEGDFGHLILCGLGGIFIEVLKDFSIGLVPINKKEAKGMISGLRSYKLIEGVRGQPGVDENVFVNILLRLSALIQIAPEIVELDLNPLLGAEDKIFAVDARIRVEKSN